MIYTRCGERVPVDEEFPEKLRNVIRQKGGFSQVAVLYIEGEFFNAASKSGPESNLPRVPDFPKQMSYIDPLTTGISIGGKRAKRPSGTLGFFFEEGRTIYGLTCGNVLYHDPDVVQPGVSDFLAWGKDSGGIMKWTEGQAQKFKTQATREKEREREK